MAGPVIEHHPDMAQAGAKALPAPAMEAPDVGEAALDPKPSGLSSDAGPTPPAPILPARATAPQQG